MATKIIFTLLTASLVASQVTFQNGSGTRLRVDNGTYGPPIEEVHYCTNQVTSLIYLY